MKTSSSVFVGLLALLSFGIDAHAGDRRRMDEAERHQFRLELQRQEFGLGRQAAVHRDRGPDHGIERGGLSPEERRALREQLRQNVVPWDSPRGRRSR